eukprot:49575_1
MRNMSYYYYLKHVLFIKCVYYCWYISFIMWLLCARIDIWILFRIFKQHNFTIININFLDQTHGVKQSVPPITHHNEKSKRARTMVKYGKYRILYGESDPKIKSGISEGSRVEKITQSSRPFFCM